MNIFKKNIRKLMGWCPNANASEIRSRTSPASVEAYDQPGGKKASNPKFKSYYSRLDSRFLMPAVFFTIYHIYLLSQKGVNAEAFLLGLLLALPIYLLGWKKQMNQYDALRKEPVVFPSFKRTFYYVFLFLILGFSLLIIFLPYIIQSPMASFLSAPILYSFTAGTLVLMWGFYFQLFYWEKKNHVKIYVKNEKGLQKMCTVSENEGKP